MNNPVTWGQLSIAGLLGGLIGSFITHLFASWRDKSKEFREAGRRLREAFAPELAALHPISGDKKARTDTLLTAAFPKHRVAILEFGLYLSGKERKAFAEAWRAYYEVGGSVRFDDYVPNVTVETRGLNGEWSTETGSYELLQERIDAILKFTTNK